MKNNIVVLCGKSGAGKDSLASMLKEVGFNFVVSHTTRPMREGESEMNPYYFIDQQTFMEMDANDEFVEFRRYETEFGVWYYGVTKSEIENDKQYVVVLDIGGLIDFKNQYFDRVVAIYVDVPDDEREARAKQRGGFDQAEWDRRLIDDNIVFSKDQIEKHCDFVVYNHDLEMTFESVLELVNGC